nr:amino acid transporter AVT3B-like [Coffea arabica]
MNPVYEVVERRFYEARYCLWMRWVTVLGVTVVALLVPNFADFLSLVGSSVCIVLGFVLPALFHLIVHKEELGWQGLALEVAIVALGLAFADRNGIAAGVRGKGEAAVCENPGLGSGFIFLMYGGIGILGYFAFSEETKVIITTNFGQGLLSSLVQLGLRINLFFTFLLMMNLVYEVAERRFCEARYCFVDEMGHGFGSDVGGSPGAKFC